MIGSLKNIESVILAGGYGTRLQSVVNDRPKVLAQVNGRPFITYILDNLAKTGIDTVTICTGYMGEEVEAAIGSTYRDMVVKYSFELFPLGTGGALRQALGLLETDPVLVTNGDSIFITDLDAFWKAHRQRGGLGSILLTESDDASRFGSVAIEGDDRITDFREKADSDGPGWINAGVYILNKELIEDIPADKIVSLEHDMFPKWVHQGLRGYRASGDFIDIGTPESYQASQDFTRRLAA